MNHTKLLDSTDCARRYQIARNTWKRMVQTGKAPAPIRLARRDVWVLERLIEWEEEVLSQRAAH